MSICLRWRGRVFPGARSFPTIRSTNSPAPGSAKRRKWQSKIINENAHLLIDGFRSLIFFKILTKKNTKPIETINCGGKIVGVYAKRRKVIPNMGTMPFLHLVNSLFKPGTHACARVHSPNKERFKSLGVKLCSLIGQCKLQLLHIDED